MELKRTDYTNPEFVKLVKLLDAELAERDGIEHVFYSQFNTIESLKLVVLAYDGNNPVSCGALKNFSKDGMEVKRMYTLPESRGKGIASLVLGELENWATELGYAKCVLETGIRQPEAIRLYEKNGYKRIPNYGQYVAMENSVCFEKEIHEA